MLLAIDDFGTGYSSLNYLRRLPVDIVKIDRSFVAELGLGGAGDTIIAGIIGLTLGLGLEVVAEGIELPEQAAALLELGCTRGQGFLYSPAVSSTTPSSGTVAGAARSDATTDTPIITAIAEQRRVDRDVEHVGEQHLRPDEHEHRRRARP